ncbi:MAG TPA: hypothetical protein ACFCUC_13560 [Desulfobacterales bacterium]
MDDLTNLPSLLPYLQSEQAGFHLELSRMDARGDSDLRPSPFLQVGACGPFGRMTAGWLTTDAETQVTPVVLLQQADRYDGVFDDLWPTRNPEVERLWQQAFERSVARRNADPRKPAPLVLAGQTDDKGGLRPFAPLFYCTRRDTFFHPRCPQCRRPLQLCKDDALLSAAGVETYTSSLRRYLYCPDCSRNPEICAFYALERQPRDPPVVGDFSTLIENGRFGGADNASKSSLPCPGCEEPAECENDARCRPYDCVVPFSFYPFYLMIFEGDFRKGRSFMQLLAGKPDAAGIPDPSRPHRGHRSLSVETPRYFFPTGSRGRFLEILYLKLAFLADLTNAILPEGQTYYRFPLSMEQVWVRLPSAGGRLPFFWDFQTQSVDLGLTAEDGTAGPYPPAYGYYFLGDFWFYALLVNAGQDADTVRDALQQCRSEMADGTPLSRVIERQPVGPVFAPANLFWNPTEPPADQAVIQLWRQSLDLGAALWMAGVQPPEGGRLPEFQANLQALQRAIHAEMFEGRFAATPAQVESDDQYIRVILETILQQWSQEITAATARPGMEPAERPETKPEAPTGAPQDKTAADDMPKTVILRRGADKAPQPPRESTASNDETLIFKPDESRLREADTADDDDDVFQQTVILRASDLEGARFEKAEPNRISEESQEYLPETVILSPAMQKPASGPKRPEVLPGVDSRTRDPKNAGGTADTPPGDADRSEGDDDADLMKTVILKPQKPKR